MNESGEVQFMNLNKHPVETHEQALNLLFLGDTNRTIAETPMNPVSSRSHCIFTVYIESKAEGTNTTRRSKLHLVDLAGSERVTRTGSSGQRFREAIYINKALHFLEQVITSLWKKDKHIPYRNSKITQVLRDSLGGNCCTAMIATLSPTCSSLAESISTCQFAQRVACVHNHAVVNQHVDPQIEIERLRHQLELLKAQMQPSSASDGDEGGAEVNIAECRELVTNYLEDPSPNSVLVLRNPRLSVECCRLLKEQVLEWKARAESMSITNDNVRAANKLQAKLMEREKEVAMLVSLMRNRTHTEEENTPEPAPPVTGKAVADLNDPPQNRHPEHYQFRQTQLPSQNDLHGSSALQNGNSPSIMMPQQRPYGKNAHQDTLHLLPTCPNPSFEDFRRQHPDNLAVVENTTLLQSMYKQAKSVAAQMEATRQHINSLKMAIEQHRLKRAMFLLEQGQESSGAEAVQQQVPRTIEEEQLCRQIEQERQSYKNQMAKLQALKSTTQTLEIMLRRLHSKIQSDFQLLGKIISEQCSDEITSDPPPTTGAFKQPVSVLEPQCFNTTRNTTEPPTHQGTREGTRPRHHTVTMPEDRRTLLENSGPAATLTGVAEADEEIRAFYRARDELTAHKANPQPPHRNKT
ncbi:kinesin 9B protein [Pelomyxa schiedti]|nr:kinesin 9B protein [Pelomyxa schiedti]